MYFEQASVVYSIVRAFAGSRVKTRRCSSRQEDIFEKTCVVYFLNCKAFGGPRFKTQRCISKQEDVF